MTEDIKFTAEEKAKIDESKMLLAEAKNSRRERLGLPSAEVARREARAEEKRIALQIAENQRLARLEAIAEREREDKLDYDNRIRKVLIDLTTAMKDGQLRFLIDQYGLFMRNYGAGQTLRQKVFTIHDNKGLAARPTDIYWVYGKGFEWE